MSHPQILHITPGDFLEKSFQLGRKLFEAGIKPRHTISIWRGGTPVGLGVDAFYRSRGIFLNHTTIATESYEGIGVQGKVVVKGLEHLINVVCREDDLLIIDDVYETGNTIRAIIETIRDRARANTPRKIYIGTIHSKPEKHCYEEFPVVSLEILPGSTWIDYPHELADLVNENDPLDSLIKHKDPRIWEILHGPPATPGAQLASLPRSYLTPAQLQYDAIELGLHMAREKQYLPDFLIALWPGGVSAGLPIHEVYKYLVKKGELPKSPNHISLNTTKTHLTYRSNIIGIEYLME
ncbi:phosphoribosyltransferase, partial [Myxococcota bacterium]|nr:phosphoribosyltransferase [Myxococcota bacterium]